MSKRHDSEEAAIGEDSFLDTIANLVGIMIILVVIVGSKTKVHAEKHSRELLEANHEKKLEQPKLELHAVSQSLVDQVVNLHEYELEMQYRQLERQALLDEVALARDEIQDKLSKLDSEQRKFIEKDSEINKLKSEVEKYVGQAGAAIETKRTKIVLEHLPTPMARTVMQKEVHVMLRAGQVIVIPWDRLIETLKQQIPLAAQRQASRTKLEDKIGPVGGFIMMYRMAAIPGGFELDRFELEPTPAVPSEPIGDVMQSTSRLNIELASRNSRETVVTVWVYPDSFDDFRKLKAHLFSQGFLCAARPLPDGVRVGGSPQGSRSSAQ
ncbi:MAG: hypothetical protein U0930_00715 [Pirellulales bacterium]